MIQPLSPTEALAGCAALIAELTIEKQQLQNELAQVHANLKDQLQENYTLNELVKELRKESDGD